MATVPPATAAAHNNDYSTHDKSAVDAPAARQAAIQGFSPYVRTLGNPGPLGLMSFASTTFILSMYNCQARHVTTPNLIVGMALGCGGLAQLLAGQWEFACGNTFGATAFTSYGAFWFSFGAIYWPGSGIMDAYKAAPAGQLESALGIYLMTWFIVTFIFFIAALRTHAAFIALFGFLSLTFILLGAGFFVGNTKVIKAGGGLGIVTAFIAYYIACSELFTRSNTFFTLPVYRIQRID
jgi:succinate-acetate transporter protein